MYAIKAKPTMPGQLPFTAWAMVITTAKNNRMKSHRNFQLKKLLVYLPISVLLYLFHVIGHIGPHADEDVTHLFGR